MGAHRKAVTRMLRATGLVHVPEEAPLVELVKQLATDLDNGAGARVQVQYLSALKDVRRVLNSAPSRDWSAGTAQPVVESIEPDESEHLAPVSKLEEYNQRWGVPSA